MPTSSAGTRSTRARICPATSLQSPEPFPGDMPPFFQNPGANCCWALGESTQKQTEKRRELRTLPLLPKSFSRRDITSRTTGGCYPAYFNSRFKGQTGQVAYYVHTPYMNVGHEYACSFRFASISTLPFTRPRHGRYLPAH